MPLLYLHMTARAVPARMSQHEKIFNDSAVPGGFVRLSPVSVNIVDTPQFQRLRNLKQLGTTDFVYPGATHTRFAHSLGVAHRARELLLRLQRRQPELGIDESDLLVVEVAGLVHDLGHGPFSHAFESELLPRMLPGLHWCHEEQSCVLFDYICSHYKTGLTPDQQQRVKDLISSGHREPQADWAGKEFMFDIVANKRNGLDVDKLDYLKRDNMACGEITVSDFGSLLESMRVIKGQICFKASRRSVVGDVYQARARMHEQVYMHPVAKAAEFQVMDALALVADELGIAEAVSDPERFALLDDTIVREVERSRSQTPEMKRAQQLLVKLRHRDCYKLCGQVDVPSDKMDDFRRVTEQEIVDCQERGGSITLSASDIRVHNVTIDFTMRQNNPLERVGFYENDGDDCFFNIEGALFEPGTYMTRMVRVYLVPLIEDVSEKQKYMTAVQKAFGRWCEQKLKASQWRSPQKSAVTTAARLRVQPHMSPAAQQAQQAQQQQAQQQAQQRPVDLLAQPPWPGGDSVAGAAAAAGRAEPGAGLGAAHPALAAMAGSRDNNLLTGAAAATVEQRQRQHEQQQQHEQQRQQKRQREWESSLGEPSLDEWAGGGEQGTPNGEQPESAKRATKWRLQLDVPP